MNVINQMRQVAIENGLYYKYSMYSLSLITDAQGLDFDAELPHGLTPIRQVQWRNSRKALRKSLITTLPSYNTSHKRQSLDIEAHHSMKMAPHTLVSLAHTRGAACAATANLGLKLLGIGVDIELQERVVRSEVHDKFLTSSDKTNEQFLYAWCAKEAAFKASSFYWKLEKTFILKDIQIDLERGLFEIPNLLEGLLFKENIKGYFISVAVVTRLF